MLKTINCRTFKYCILS